MKPLLLALALTFQVIQFETGIRLTIDQVEVWNGHGITYLSVYGWAVGNGFVPEKGLYVDGQYVLGLIPRQRGDVCRVVRDVWHWRCDDDRPKFCAGLSAALEDDCVGVWQTIDISTLAPGVHRATICATHLAKVDGAPVRACSLTATFTR